MVVRYLLLLSVWFAPLLTLAQIVTINEGEFTTHSSNAPRFGTPIVTGSDGAIYVCYVTPALTTVISRKDPDTGAWSTTELEAITQADDFHNQCSLGLDKNGYIHAAYNMHDSPWRYKRSDAPHSIAAFTFLGQDGGTNPGASFPAAAQCTGQCETDWLTDEPGIAAIPGNQITYPHFAVDQVGDLYVAFRECLNCAASFFARQWSAGIAKYNADTQTWSRLGGIRPWATQPQKLPIGLRLWGDTTPNNRLHASWVYCNAYTQTEGGQACFANNNYVSYAYSDDGGTTWRQADGTAMTLPLDFDESARVVGPAWFDDVGATGYYSGHTGLIAQGRTGMPVLTVHPNTTNNPLGINRGSVWFTNGAWTYPPLVLSFSPAILYEDAEGIWTGVSSGLRLHRAAAPTGPWTLTELDSTRGAFSTAFDPLYLRQTNHLRLYANNTTSGLLVVWTVQFPETRQRYYVSTTGNDTNNCLAPWSACATISGALAKAVCGDTIQVQAGVYFQRTVITATCTADAPLTIQGLRGPGGTWNTHIEGSDATSGWTSASAQCSGCWRIANPGYTPFALTATAQHLSVWKIHQSNNLTGPACPGCSGTGFEALSRSATSTINWGLGTVNYWDGVEALWGSEGGFTYVKFRNADDPNTLNVRVAPGGTADGATFNLSGASSVILKDLQIGGARYPVHVQAGSTNNTIEQCFVRGGEAGIRVNASHQTVIRDNVLNPWYIGSVAGYTSTPNLPGDWNSRTPARRIMGNIYRVNKFDVGNTREGHSAIELSTGSDGTHIEGNTVPLSVLGIDGQDSTNTMLLRNSFSSCSAECVWFNEATSMTALENVFVDGDHHLRIQRGNQNGRTLYWGRNLHYQPEESAKHTYFSFDTGQTVTNSVFWFYHNTFTGSGWVNDIGEAPAGGLPCARFLNNVVSVTGASGTRGISSVGMGGKYGVYAYNWTGEIASGQPASGTNGQGCTGWVGNNIATAETIWATPPIPDYVLPDAHAAIDSGLRLDQNFVLNGITYAALPGMTAAYYGDAAPDRGALQGGDTPPPPEPVLSQAAGACYQVDLQESTPEGLRQIPCAVKPGGRIRVVLPVSLTGANVTSAFGFYAADSGGSAYKLTTTLGANRLAIGPDTQMGLPPVTPRLPLGGQTYDECCRWRQGNDPAQACTLSAAGTGEQTECGITLSVAPGATPGQVSTLSLRHDDGSLLNTATPLTVTIIQASGEGM